jgi:hypothetical protein
MRKIAPVGDRQPESQADYVTQERGWLRLLSAVWAVVVAPCVTAVLLVRESVISP